MSIPGAASPLFLATTGAADAFEISRSLRFNSADSAYLNRTPSSASNRKTWTWSAWVKRSSNTQTALFHAGSSNQTVLWFDGNHLEWTYYAGGYGARLRSSALFRDFSAWMHVVFVLDTTQATADSRMRMYVNGAELTDFAARTNPSQNADYNVNNTVAHEVGRNNVAGGYNFNGYLAEINFVDGSALDPTSFGQADANGVWQAKDTAGLTFGTNGFRLKFADNSSNAALGTDSSSNSNTWTVNNLTAAAPSTATITHARIYASYGGGTRGANYSVDYSDNGSSWTTAFTGNMTASGCGLITGTGVGNGSYGAHKYWRYVIGSATNDHHPNAARYVLSDGTTDYNIVVYYADNCNDQGNFQSVDRILTFPVNPEGVDSLVDTPTNGTASSGGDPGGSIVGNYATLSAVDNAGVTLSNGSLEVTTSGWQSFKATIGVSSGKYYWESQNKQDAAAILGVATAQASVLPSGSIFGSTGHGGGDSNPAWAWAGANYYFNATTAGTGLSNHSSTDIVMYALDLDNGKLWFGRNGTWYSSSWGTNGNPATGANATVSGLNTSYTYLPAGTTINGGAIYNFGQRAFAYAAPTGFKSLNTANLPTPTIADGSKYFDTKLWTGSGSSRSITGYSFSPDWVWIKPRNAAYNNALFDIVRGSGKRLKSNDTVAEDTDNNTLSGFASDGFTLGTNNGVNQSSKTYVGWAWDGGTSTVTNNDGSIASQVRASAASGFSVVTYTVGNNTAQTIGHGLNAAPHLIIVKERNQANNWQVYHSSLGNGNYLWLNSTNASAANVLWNSTSPTNSVFSIRSGGSAQFYDGKDHVAYCFAPVNSYSAMGSYQGNGSSSSPPFVYLGFKPRWVMIKDINNTFSWIIIDTERDSHNLSQKFIRADFANAEIDNQPTNASLDIVSNGFTVRASGSSQINSSGATLIYLAFASNPFQANGGLAR